MATAARLDMVSWRNRKRVFTLRVRGVDLTGKSLRQQIRQTWDNPVALISLAAVTNANAEGLYLKPITYEDGQPVSTIVATYNMTTMRDRLPYSGEIGDDARFYHEIEIDGVTRLFGDWWARASVIDSDGAPLMRPAGYGNAISAPGAPASGASATIAGEDVAELVIDGAGLLNLIAAASEEARDAARASEAAARDQANLSQVRATLSGTEADRAEAAAQGALLAVADGVYDTPEAGLADHAADGSEAYFAIDDDSSLALLTNQGGTPERKVNIATHQSLRENGINLAEAVGYKLCLAADPSDLASDWKHVADTINDVMATARAWGIGVVQCGGARRTYICGGDQVTFGVQAIQPIGHDVPYDMPFKRGQLMMQSNVELRGNSKSSRPTFLAAPEHDPGPLFGHEWWNGVVTNDFTVRNLDLDANEENYTVSAYDLGVDDGPMWIQGHCFASGTARGLLVHGCRIHGWWGHGVFGGDRDFRIYETEFFNNMQGGTQCAVVGFRSVRNHFHGNGGWTAVGENLETGGEDQDILDVWIVDNLYDMRDGLSTTIATAKRFATNSQAALDARRHFRRAIWLSGNEYTSPPVFAGRRGRVHIVRPHIYQGNIGGRGFDRIDVDAPMILNTYEPGIIQFPVASQAINFAQANFETGLRHLSIRAMDVQHYQDNTSAVQIGGFPDVDISGTIVGPKGAGLRLEGCGGRVAVQVRDFGGDYDTVDFWKSLDNNDEQAAALVGSASAAVTVFGQTGPLDISVNAHETRAGDARLGRLVAYVNTGFGHATAVRGVATNLVGIDGDLLKVPAGAVADAGIYAPDRLDRRMRSGLATGGTITTPHAKISNPTSDAYIDFAAADGANQGLNFFDANGLASSVRQTSEDQFAIQRYVAGSFPSTFSITADGHAYLTATWQRPLQLDGANFYWTSAAGQLRFKAGRPTGDADGGVVGDQTAGA